MSVITADDTSVRGIYEGDSYQQIFLLRFMPGMVEGCRDRDVAVWLPDPLRRGACIERSRLSGSWCSQHLFDGHGRNSSPVAAAGYHSYRPQSHDMGVDR